MRFHAHFQPDFTLLDVTSSPMANGLNCYLNLTSSPTANGLNCYLIDSDAKRYRWNRIDLSND